MDVSNKTLAMFLVAAIAISVFGTVISLQKLGQVSFTGRATTDTGNVSVSIASLLSITTSDDNDIAFGSCTPDGGTDHLITSETANGGTSPNDICAAFAAPDEILIRNDGNVLANVSLNHSDCGDATNNIGCTFLATDRDVSWIAYKTTNASSHGTYDGGCNGAVQTGYTNFTNTTSMLLVCDRLKFGATDNSVELDIQMRVPFDYASGQDDVIITFVAENVA